MNQQCKVCGEPAAGFHFGAFTCEGCKSFFGRSYNNLNSITECKNNGECIINKKNRTACKSCRLRKCLLVGMSKSGSRYGRRSNWFKIHCLLQEQQQAAVAQMKGTNPSSTGPLENPLPLLSPLAFPHPNLGTFLRPNNSSSPSVSSPDSDSSEPGPYSPRMNGTSSFVNKDFYLPVPFHSMFMQPPSMASPFLLPPSLIPFPVPPAKRSDYSQRLISPDHVQNFHKKSSTPDLAEEERIGSNSPPSRHSPTNNNDYSSKYTNHNKLNISHELKSKCSNNNNFGINNKNIDSKNNKVTVRSKRFYLDAILGLKDVADPEPEDKDEGVEGEERRGRKISRERQDGDEKGEGEEQEQVNPIDLSVKSSNFRSNSTSQKSCCQENDDAGNEGRDERGEEEMEDEGSEEMEPRSYNNHDELKPIPLDLTV